MKYELKEFGLTENETKVYLALTKLGESTASPIKNESKLHTSRVYEALNSLIDKGMVSYYLKNNTRHFIAQNPEIMYNILDDKKEKLKTIIPEILALKNKQESGYSTSIYEGYKAIKQLYENILDHLKKDDEILVLGAQEENAHFLGTRFFRQFTKARIEKQVKMRMIFYEDAKESAKTYSEFELTKVRVLPSKSIAPSAMNIYKDQISILVLKEKPFVFHIKCQEVAQSYITYFEFLWNQSKELGKNN